MEIYQNSKKKVEKEKACGREENFYKYMIDVRAKMYAAGCIKTYV